MIKKIRLLFSFEEKKNNSYENEVTGANIIATECAKNKKVFTITKDAIENLYREVFRKMSVICAYDRARVKYLSVLYSSTKFRWDRCVTLGVISLYDATKHGERLHGCG